MVRQCAESQEPQIGIIANLQGQKIRTERFKEDKVIFREGDDFTLDVAWPSDGGTASWHHL